MAAVIGIIIGRAVIIGRSEEVPVMMPERESAMAKAATVEYVAAAEATAMKDRAAAMETPAMETPAVETTSAKMAATAVAAPATMAAANFSDQSVGDGFRGRGRAWIDRRECFGAVARDG